MGLDTSHDCWHGGYINFSEWRRAVCKAAKLGELHDYVGFGGDKPWPDPKTDALVYLLNHSDCDGRIAARRCQKIAERLEALLPELTRRGQWVADAACRWIQGLRRAANSGEAVEFK